jgi:RNA polymerase sigma-70 factor (ECF subfamily)
VAALPPGEPLTIQEQSPPLSTVAYRPRDRSRREEDRELVLLHLQGDRDAFSIIAENHYKELKVRARNLLGPHGDYEDAVQETFLRALRGLKQFGLTGEYRLGAWLNAILQNVCSDQRTRASRDQLLAQNAGREPRHHGDVADQVSDPQTVEFVKSAIQSLPPSLRSAFVRHELDEVPYSVLAEMENSSVELSRTRVHRAKSSLRQSLAGIETAAGGLIAVPFLRAVRARFARLVRSGARPSTKALGDRLSASSVHPTRWGRGGAPSVLNRWAAQVTSSSLRQSALTLVTSTPPRHPPVRDGGHGGDALGFGGHRLGGGAPTGQRCRRRPPRRAGGRRLECPDGIVEPGPGEPGGTGHTLNLNLNFRVF